MKKTILLVHGFTHKELARDITCFIFSLTIVIIIFVQSQSLQSAILAGFILAVAALLFPLLNLRLCILDKTSVRIVGIHGMIWTFPWEKMVAVGKICTTDGGERIFFCGKHKKRILRFFSEHDHDAKKFCTADQYNQRMETDEGRWNLALEVYLIYKLKKFDAEIYAIPFRKHAAEKIRQYYPGEFLIISSKKDGHDN